MIRERERGANDHAALCGSHSVSCGVPHSSDNVWSEQAPANAIKRRACGGREPASQPKGSSAVQHYLLELATYTSGALGRHARRCRLRADLAMDPPVVTRLAEVRGAEAEPDRRRAAPGPSQAFVATAAQGCIVEPTSVVR